VSNYILKLIEGGENQQLDFKFEINDSRKIARTLVAFSNTDGGTILIGVKDNGKIAGIRTDEEYHMIEAAAQMYCKPVIEFRARQWEIDNRVILEISVPKSEIPPHYALSKENKWLAYIRKRDENILANSVMIKMWKRNNRKYGTFLSYRENEKWLLEYLAKHSHISISGFCRATGLSKHRAEIILVNLIIMGIIEIDFEDTNFIYRLIREDLIQKK
jgi:predicted HTH transcriptional regulator